MGKCVSAAMNAFNRACLPGGCGVATTDGGKITFSWVEPTTADWLLGEFASCLGMEVGDDLISGWRKLQEEMCNYLSKAWQYQFEVQAGKCDGILDCSRCG